MIPIRYYFLIASYLSVISGTWYLKSKIDDVELLQIKIKQNIIDSADKDKVIANLNTNIAYNQIQSMMASAKAESLIQDNNKKQQELLNAKQLIAKDEANINMHNSLSTEWMCILEATSTGAVSTDTAVSCPDLQPGRKLPTAYSQLSWEAGLIIHDQQATDQANACSGYVTDTITKYNSMIK